MSNVRIPTDSNESFPVKINILDHIKDQIKNYALSDLTRELGGVLLGYVIEKDSKYIVNVEDFLIAKYTDAKLSSITFTAETWSQINNELEEKDSDLKIVGWFHTHPGFGIFLSNWDIFIQDNFFNIPWQIAYVVDPCHKTDGFFIWKENEIIKIEESDFNDINNESKNTEKTEDNIINKPNKEANDKILFYKIFNKNIKFKKIITIINYILIILLIFIILYILYKHFPLEKIFKYINELKII